MAILTPLLSEAELLKMPEEDYMNEQQLEFFRNKLSQIKQDIMHEIKEAKQCITEQNASADPVDAASDQEILQTSLRVVERRSKLLKKVSASLHRIDSGDYGYCDLSDEPIGLKRLLARPTATLSIAAKERQEFLERTEGRTTKEAD